MTPELWIDLVSNVASALTGGLLAGGAAVWVMRSEGKREVRLRRLDRLDDAVSRLEELARRVQVDAWDNRFDEERVFALRSAAVAVHARSKEVSPHLALIARAALEHFDSLNIVVGGRPLSILLEEPSGVISYACLLWLQGPEEFELQRVPYDALVKMRPPPPT